MQRSVVLIHAPEEDIHARSVAHAIGSKYPDYRVVIVDGRQFPTRISFSIQPDGWTLTTPQTTIHSSEVCALWYRRPKAPVADETITDAAARQFALRECIHAFDFLSISREYPVVNPPANQFMANRKPYQLAVAASCGLRVPEYNITNDPRYVDEILDRYGEDNYIFKALSAPVHTFGETRFLKNSYRNFAGALRHAPAILQRTIPREKELRVTFIGDQIFTQEMVVHNELAKTIPDWRVDVTAEARPAELDPLIASQIKKLMSTLGLCYGAIDFIQSTDGLTYFLEVNPQGQFLFGEIDTQAPMSLAFADLLTHPFEHGAIPLLT
jgi:glutathione synthase/RimK-type ligase-like ATP-grasp enzyme